MGTLTLKAEGSVANQGFGPPCFSNRVNVQLSVTVEYQQIKCLHTYRASSTKLL